MLIMNIVILEDDNHYLKWLVKTVQQDLGHNVVAVADNFDDGVSCITKFKPNLVISDVHLKTEKSGFDLAETLNELSIPIIFISEDGTDDNYQKVKKTGNYSFLVKPFHKFSLSSLLDKFINASIENNHKQLILNSGTLTNIVNEEDIRWIESDRNYVTICTSEKRIVLRASMSSILENLDKENFIRIHKSYTVAIKFIKSINYNKSNLDIGVKVLPIGRSYRTKVKELFSIRDPDNKIFISTF